MESNLQDRMINLIQEAIGRIASLGRQEEFALLPVFIDARNSLQGSFYNEKTQKLLLRAAAQRIVHAEKHTVSLIIGDVDISISEMSHLVRIRLICAEVINLLNQVLDELRLR
jgi:hypothetical protein